MALNSDGIYSSVRMHCSNQCCVFRDLLVMRELLDAMEPLEPR